VLEKAYFVGLLARKSVRYGQGATLVGLERMSCECYQTLVAQEAALI